MKEQLGGAIRARRDMLGLSQKDLAQRMFGKSERESYISIVENGRIVINVERLQQFAQALDWHASDLLLAASPKAAV